MLRRTLRVLQPALATTALLALTFSALAKPTVFRAWNDERDVVQFTSKAPMEKIVGTNARVQAEVTVEDLNDILNKKVTGKVVVDLTTMQTGISLRDKHMREQYLETDKYPHAVFTLKKVQNAYRITKDGEMEQKTPVRGLSPNETIYVDLVGELELHGVKRDLTIQGVEVTYIPASEATKTVRPGDLLRIAGGFRIQLSDFNIERPRLVLLKLSNDVDIDFDIILGTGVQPKTAAAAANPCGGNPCGGNPCGGNPCGGNPCGGNPCGGNPCGGNPCGGNPCGGNPNG